ncbi:MAG: hypothetical protein LUQ28_15185, partial [Methylococcaceae bacterium]|nr:hypothetical protein [Methylococcaceae bacterium]
MSNETSIKIDLWHDYSSIIKSHLIREGFDLSKITNDDEIIISYLNLLKRSVSCTQRKILKSKEFKCPSKFANSLNNIENLIKNGLDITAYLSNKINELDYNDEMMNDWGIHHLHLGERGKNGRIKRTGELLFVKFTHDCAYFIGIYDHSSWTRKNIIEVVHSNWSDIIKQHKCENIISLSHEPNENDIKN